MVNLPKISDLDVEGKRVLVRADLDVGESLEDGDNAKLLTNKETIDYLLGKNAKVILISHRGRPEGKVSQSLSLSGVSERLSKLINKKIEFVYDLVGLEAKEAIEKLETGNILMLENLRFDPREDENSESLALALSSFADIYINEAFSSSAKSHASIVALAKIFKEKSENNVAFGFHFVEEVENLSKVFDGSNSSVVSIISGIKEDKLTYVEKFARFSDKVLVAGRLPEIIDARGIGKTDLDPQVRDKILKLIEEDKVIVADLIQDKEDITLHTIERFEKIIYKAEIIIVGGPIGRYEDPGHRQGTQRVFGAVTESKGSFKVAGGGDTEQALNLLGIKGKFDWVSVAGGAMLDFLADKTLPAIEALTK